MSPEALCALSYWRQEEPPEPQAANALASAPVTPVCPASSGPCPLPPQAHSSGTLPGRAALHHSLFHGPEAQEGHPGNLGMPDSTLKTVLQRQC